MITETVLEMHYHKPLMDLFRGVFGVGIGSINFYKYSPQRECFVGFAQAYAKTDLSEDAFFSGAVAIGVLVLGPHLLVSLGWS